MKINIMNRLKALLSAILVLGLVTMCREDNPDFIDIDSVPRGAYVRVISFDVSTGNGWQHWSYTYPLHQSALRTVVDAYYAAGSNPIDPLALAGVV